MSKNVKWVTLDNATGESTLRQHGFKPKTRRSRFSNGEYLSNVSLCGKIVVGNEDEEIEHWELIVGEIKSDSCCKTCDRIFKKDIQ